MASFIPWLQKGTKEEQISKALNVAACALGAIKQFYELN